MARELSKKEFNTIFWRSFTLLGSFNYERMEGLGFLYAILPSLKRIYKDDPEGLKQAEHRHMEAFNMTVAPSPFVMGLTVAMEEQAKEDPSFDKGTINALKVSLMGPLSGIGDTFFWGIFRVLACSLGASFALQGNILGPIVLLLVFNIPNFLTRYYGLRIGYGQGAGYRRYGIRRLSDRFLDRHLFTARAQHRRQRDHHSGIPRPALPAGALACCSIDRPSSVEEQSLHDEDHGRHHRYRLHLRYVRHHCIGGNYDL